MSSSSSSSSSSSTRKRGRDASASSGMEYPENLSGVIEQFPDVVERFAVYLMYEICKNEEEENPLSAAKDEEIAILARAVGILLLSFQKSAESGKGGNPVKSQGVQPAYKDPTTTFQALTGLPNALDLNFHTPFLDVLDDIHASEVRGILRYVELSPHKNSAMPEEVPESTCVVTGRKSKGFLDVIVYSTVDPIDIRNPEKISTYSYYMSEPYSTLTELYGRTQAIWTSLDIFCKENPNGSEIIDQLLDEENPILLPAVGPFTGGSVKDAARFFVSAMAKMLACTNDKKIYSNLSGLDPAWLSFKF